MLADNKIVDKPPHIVEVVGPAAAGKTTFLLTLSNRKNNIQPILGLRSTRNVPSYVINAILLLPVLLQQYHDGTWHTWSEINAMIRLRSLRHILRRQALKKGPVIIDQGPIFTLTGLLELGSDFARSQSFERWWNSILKQWASMLDMVIWLDAPDEILVQRIRARNKWHLVKERPDQDAKEFVARNRTYCEKVFSKLTSSGGPKLLRLDADKQSPDQLVDKALIALDMDHSDY